MAKKHQKTRTVFSFVIAKLFPTSDPIAIDLLRLMSGCNDIYFLEEWLNAHKQIPNDKHAKTIAAGRNSLQIRLLYSFLHESLCVIYELKDRPEFKELRSSLDEDGMKALGCLLTVKLKGLKPEKKDWGFNESLLRARHAATFHYDFDKIKEALKFWFNTKGADEESFIISQQKTGPLGSRPYYSIADMVRSEISFGISNPKHEENLKRALELIEFLLTFTDSFFLAYIKTRNLDGSLRSL